METAIEVGGRNAVEQRVEGHEKFKPSQNVVVFVGPEGSGKTSQAKLFAEQIGLPYFTYGDVFRDAAKNDQTELGAEFMRPFLKHDYVKLAVLEKLISRELRKEEYQNGVVIDGDLRLEGETELLVSLLSLAGIENPNITVFYLRIPGWKAFERTVVRGRADDTVEGMMGRLGAFYTGLGQRSSELRKMSKEGKLRFIQIDATKTIDGVGEELLRKFK